MILEIDGGDEVDLSLQQRLQLLPASCQLEQADVGRDVDQKIDVTLLSLIATSHTAEHTKVADPMAGSDPLDLAATGLEPLEQRAPPASRCATGSHTNIEFEARGGDKPRQHGERRLPCRGFVGAHHALGCPSALGKLNLREGRPAPCLSQHCPRPLIDHPRDYSGLSITQPGVELSRPGRGSRCPS